jgi:hypothetical protein
MATEFIFKDDVDPTADAFRIQARNDGTGTKLCTDMVLNATGFAGAESLDEGGTGDWMNLDKIPPDE